MTYKEYTELDELLSPVLKYLFSKRREIEKNRRTHILKLVKPTPQALARKRFQKKPIE